MARLEALVAVPVLVGVVVVTITVWRTPGPLVVQAQDDHGQPLMGATVRCTGPGGARSFDGITDVFGETKWPGLDKGPWTCVANPPDRFHGAPQRGSAVVVSRVPAIVRVRFPRPVRLGVEVKRPEGQHRAEMAVRAVCAATSSTSAVAWEARTSLLGGAAILWVPAGRACRAGIVHAALPAERAAGLSPKLELECDRQPCAAEPSLPAGTSLDLSFAPSAEQWAEARPR
jgi:hypothetical protein